MARRNDEVRALMGQGEAEREALSATVSELNRRCQPRHLVDVGTRFAKQKVVRVAGGVSDAVKENGGAAAAVALGAVAVFDAGRRSADAAREFAADPQRPEGGGHADAAPLRYQQPQPNNVTNLERGKVLVASAGGLLLGHVIGKSFETTDKERALFGTAASDIKDATDRFVAEHARGAKLAAAQAFGLARFTATLLAMLAAASDYFVRADRGGDTPAE